MGHTLSLARVGRLRPVRILLRLSRRSWAIVGVLVFWQVWIWTHDTSLLVQPGPADIVHDMVDEPGLYLRAAVPTLGAALFGWVIGTTIGALVALATGLSRILTGLSSPTLLLLRSFPIVMMVPILTKIFGAGEAKSVYTITTIVALFPAFVLVSTSVAATPISAERVARAFGSTRLRRLWFIHLPGAVPSYFSALQLTAGITFLVAIIAEFLTGADGIGNEYIQALAFLDTARLWGVSIFSAVIGVVFYRLAQRLDAIVARRMS